MTPPLVPLHDFTTLVRLSMLQYHCLFFPSFPWSDHVVPEIVWPGVSSTRLIDGSWWESGLTTWWCCWGRWDIMEHPDLSHCTWLQRVGMIRDGDFMRWWLVDYDDKVRWLSEDIDDYHRASMGTFTRFQRSHHDFVGRVPAFSIDHVRSLKHDVRGYGHRMGGHHFGSLFTISLSHIELPITIPLSLIQAHSLFFHHLIYLLHRVGDPVVLACYDRIRHEFWTWHTYSGLIPRSSFVIFSTWSSFHHYFMISHITTCDIHSLSFLSSLITQHYPCFTLSGGFSQVTTWRIVTSFPLSALWAMVQRSYFERLSC